MFGFLKDKLKSAMSLFKKKIEESPEDIVEEEVKPEPKTQEKSESKKIEPKKETKPEPKKPEPKKEIKPESKMPWSKKEPEKPKEEEPKTNVQHQKSDSKPEPKHPEPKHPAPKTPEPQHKPPEPKHPEPKPPEPQHKPPELEHPAPKTPEPQPKHPEPKHPEPQPKHPEPKHPEPKPPELKIPASKFQTPKTPEPPIKEGSEQNIQTKTESHKEPEKSVESKSKPGFFKRVFGWGKKEELKEEPKLEVKEIPESKETEESTVKEAIAQPEEEAREELEKEPVSKKESTSKEESIFKEEFREEVTSKESVLVDKKESEESKPVQPESIKSSSKYIEPTPEPSPEKHIQKTPIQLKPIKKTILKESKPEPEVKKGFFSRLTEKITTRTLSKSQFEEIFWDLELGLLENNVAVEVIEKIKHDLEDGIVEKPIKRGKEDEAILSSLKKSIYTLFVESDIDLLELAKNKQKQNKPLVICFFGINGSGKTTTIAKLANFFKSNGLDVVLAAGDTFRAAAIDQLDHHANKLDVKIIKYDYGADPAAVAFDAIKHAEQTKKPVVLIDTAGRMHSNFNLMDEMKKIIRVSNPDLKIFIGESITGNDCIEQAKAFNESVGIDGIVLSKADVDEKGGAALSVSYVTKKPILFLGTGQGYEDLTPFDIDAVMERLGL